MSAVKCVFFIFRSYLLSPPFHGMGESPALWREKGYQITR